MNTNIQRALLASFLWANDLGIDTNNAFILDVSVFDWDRVLIASKINEVTMTKDRFYSLLNLELENTSQNEWMHISEQTPMPFSLAKKYHDKLISDRNHAILAGVA